MMDQESVVYGCIKDLIYSDELDQFDVHQAVNQTVMAQLPSVDDWPLLSREMFSMAVMGSDLSDSNTHVVHFGSSYKSIEYEWEQWINSFEAMLKKMYWVSATVHLETELNGRHTFTWEAANDGHIPDSGDFSVRCEWSRETC